MGLLMLIGLFGPIWYVGTVRPDIFWIELALLVVLITLAYTIDHIRGFRRPEEIPLDAITDIDFIDASMWTHKRFIISYKEDGRIYKRRIRLPSQQFSYTAQELDAAKQLFGTLDISSSG